MESTTNSQQQNHQENASAEEKEIRLLEDTIKGRPELRDNIIKELFQRNNELDHKIIQDLGLKAKLIPSSNQDQQIITDDMQEDNKENDNTEIISKLRNETSEDENIIEEMKLSDQNHLIPKKKETGRRDNDQNRNLPIINPSVEMGAFSPVLETISNHKNEKLFIFQVFGNNSEANRALEKFRGLSRDLKPALKDLEKEILKIIKSYETSGVVLRGMHLSEFLFIRFFEIYEQPHQKNRRLNRLIQVLFFKMILRLPKLFSLNNQIKKLASNSWSKLKDLQMVKFLITYDLINLLDSKDMVLKVQELIKSGPLKTVADFIMRSNVSCDSLDLDILITRCIQKKKIKILKDLVLKKDELKTPIIEGFLQKNIAIAREFIICLGLNPSDFINHSQSIQEENVDQANQPLQPSQLDQAITKIQPVQPVQTSQETKKAQLEKSLNKAFLKYLFKEKNWMSVEAIYYDCKNALYFITELLLKQNKFDEARSLISRHNLDQDESDKYKVIADLLAQFADPSLQDLHYLPNKLYLNDDFIPGEEILGLAELGTYCHYRDFGIDVTKNLIFIDDSSSEEFVQATEDLLSSKEVGLDGEFTLGRFRNDKCVIALLQLANHQRVYLFDTLRLGESPEYHTFVGKLLSSPNIEIVGHTLSSDIKKLNQSRPGMPRLKISNQIDIAKIFKKLYREEKKSSLAYICERILKKPMSKFDQVSNWKGRPLRKAQMHYAGLDALIVLKIYDKLKDKIKLRAEEKSSITKIFEGDIEETKISDTQAKVNTHKKIVFQNQDPEEIDKLGSSLIKEIVFGDDLQQKKALIDFGDFLATRKLLKMFKDIAKQQIRSQLDFLAPTEDSLFKASFKKIFDIYEKCQTMGLSKNLTRFWLEMIIHLPTLIPQTSLKEAQDLALSCWGKIEEKRLDKFLKSFGVCKNHINTGEALSRVQTLVDQRNLKEALIVIKVLDLFREYDIKDLILEVVKTKQLGWLVPFAQKSVVLQKDIIKILLNQNKLDIITDFILDVKFNLANFPELIHHFQIASLKVLCKQANWVLLEERFRNSKPLLSSVVEHLVQEQKIDIACSIIKRNNLPINDINQNVLTKLSPYLTDPPKDCFVYIPNKLFTDDDFLPTEEILEKIQTKSHLHLTDFGIDPIKDLTFIDNAASEAFDLAEQDLLNSTQIGFAAEHNFKMTKFENDSIALLQLANHNKIYIFDSTCFSNSPKLLELLQKLFSSNNTYIVGYNLPDSLGKLRKTLKKPNLNIQNPVNIAFIYRQVFQVKQIFPLLDISTAIFAKHLSLYEKNSSWKLKPLRKAQLHYAGLNALILLKIFEKLQQETILRGESFDSIIQNQFSKPQVKTKNKKTNNKKKEKDKAKIFVPRKK